LSDVFCLASNDEDFPTLAECTRRNGHDGHHCDTRKKLSWDGSGEVQQCPTNWDHGHPPNRAARRSNVQHPRSAGSRPDYRPGFAR
jgi:hypothetical protein